MPPKSGEEPGYEARDHQLFGMGKSLGTRLDDLYCKWKLQILIIIYTVPVVNSAVLLYSKHCRRGTSSYSITAHCKKV